MRTFTSYLAEQTNNIPPQPVPPRILYHATYRQYVPSIFKKGLIPRFHVVWEDCETGIYLANDPHEAISYAETTDNPNIHLEYLDDIVVFSIDITKLDKSKIAVDPHVQWGENPNGVSTWIYKTTVPPTAFINGEKIRNGGNGL